VEASWELGSAKSYLSLACVYQQGVGVEKDEKKASHYFELAAIGGDVDSRHQLAIYDHLAGNVDKVIASIL
jgi:TPR repeat protein